MARARGGVRARDRRQPSYDRSVDRRRLELLRGIGLQGATLDRAAGLGLTPHVAQALVDDGLVRRHRIPLRETGPSSQEVVVLMLTPAGAGAIGEDPLRIGLA